MHVKVDRVLANTEDFKVCTECGAINWYENDRCVMCGSQSFRKLKVKDILAIEAIYPDPDTEIDV